MRPDGAIGAEPVPSVRALRILRGSGSLLGIVVGAVADVDGVDEVGGVGLGVARARARGGDVGGDGRRGPEAADGRAGVVVHQHHHPHAERAVVAQQWRAVDPAHAALVAVPPRDPAHLCRYAAPFRQRRRELLAYSR